MICEHLQDELFEAIDQRRTPDGPLALRLRSCSSCAQLFESQRLVDADLAGAFPPPALNPRLRTMLRRRIEAERAPAWWPALPEIVHLAACSLATAVCGVLLPVPAGLTLLLGGLATGVSYVLLVLAEEATMRS